MTEPRVTWSEDATDIYQRIAAIAVPHRAQQIAAMLTLLPFGVDEHFRAVELGAGEGRLAAAILEAFPNSRVTALDGSESMRETCRERLSRYQGRFEIQPFDLLDAGWWHHLDGAGATLSSLVVHHLDGPGKQELFGQVARRMGSKSALIVADLVLPGNSRASELYGGSYDAVAQRQSRELTGSDAYFQDFLNEEWNFFRYPDEDDWDKPSPLSDQLRWLDEAGFDLVDCFWMQAGHAIYGGFKGSVDTSNGLTWDRALEIATSAVNS